MRLYDFTFVGDHIAGAQHDLAKTFVVCAHPAFEHVSEVKADRVIMQRRFLARSMRVQSAADSGGKAAVAGRGDAKVAVLQKSAQAFLLPLAVAELGIGDFWCCVCHVRSLSPSLCRRIDSRGAGNHWRRTAFGFRAYPDVIFPGPIRQRTARNDPVVFPDRMDETDIQGSL